MKGKNSSATYLFTFIAAVHSKITETKRVHHHIAQVGNSFAPLQIQGWIKDFICSLLGYATLHPKMSLCESVKKRLQITES